MTTSELNERQKAAVERNGNVLVTACPGSGKTRVLTHRVQRELQELASTKHRVIALTFTNRAAEEIRSRIDCFETPMKQLWTGTIHAFALDWILRPYAGYAPGLKFGFSVADEFYSRKAIDALKDEFGLRRFDKVSTGFDRDGLPLEKLGREREIIEKYHSGLSDNRLIDFDMILSVAFQVLKANQEIPATLGAIMRLICIDEVQDTQDLQFAILSEIVKASKNFSKLFAVGDADQAIYATLGGTNRTADEIKTEFELDTLEHLELVGNYRSTQRVIEFCAQFRSVASPINSMAKHADDSGVIAFSNQEIDRIQVPNAISHLIRENLNVGIPEHEICVLAPRWQFVTNLGRQLVRLLPDVSFDAPGLSPLRMQQDTVWYKLARLFLTEPEPRLYRSRTRLANEVVRDLEFLIGRELDPKTREARQILRIRNSIHSDEVDGLDNLSNVFNQFLRGVGIDVDEHIRLATSKEVYFEGAVERLNDPDYAVPSDIESLRKLFQHPAGVVVSTCHSVKGEEYETVICFGLLRGYVPHWEAIIDGDTDDADESNKLLYVVCSRAKRNVYLIAENGRTTRKGRPYDTTSELAEANFNYDECTFQA